ncbi:mucin-5AC-like isoform X2 [Xyrauchen texanus]|uniref:mucin-5AC-like isoform X2 n=1 Tax=Xyrauchen texanus TaxID=154827 RepID=UPI0022421538|nr:mucin-5AC-like isoform X2 [Xyrauchen texanus]
MERRNIFGLLYICSSIFSLIATQNTTDFTNSSNLTTASPNNSNLTTASPNNSNITTASPNNSNITTASPNNSNITTASPNNSNITTTSPNNSNITTTSPNNGNITTASTISTTTSTASTISTTTAPVTKFNLIFSISETFIAVYSNLNDPETIKLKDRITTGFFKVYQTRFQNFVRMVILRFRSGSVVTDSVLEFNNNGTIPNVSDVTNTLVQAATNGSFNFTVDTNSINITELAVTQNVTSTTTFTSSITTASPNNTNITTASPNNTNITTASPNNTNITTASPNNTNITTASPNNSSNTTASPNNSSITNASPNNSSITTASTISTTTSTPPVTKFNLSFSISETFIAIYSNLNDPETIKLKDRITTGFFKVYKTRFQNFARMVILRFRSGSIVTDSVLEFSNNGTIPNVSEVRNTLVQAATNGSFNFTVDTNSINITELAVTQNVTSTTTFTSSITTASPNNTNITTASPNNTNITTASPNNSSNTTASPNNTNITTASPNNSSITTASPNNSSITTASTISTTTAPVTKFNLSFSISETFIAVYSNLNDPETIKLKDRITTGFFKVYKTRFQNFARMVILRFRSGSVVTDSVLEFNNNGTIPNVSDVRNTLVQAATNGSFNFTVDTNSINITELAVTQNVTSTTTFTSSITTASPNNTNITSASPNNTNITSASPNNSSITTASTISTTTAPVTKFNVIFSISETFNAVYSNLNDPETIKLKDRITTEFFKVYKARFQNFVRMVIQLFRSGSVVTDSVLEFNNNGTIPNVTLVARTLVQAVKDGNFTFTIDVNSINVTDSSGNSSSRSPVLASMLTALWMTLTSFLLSAVMHL